MTDLQNRHQNKMAFILGAGPSLHFQDISPLKDYVTFTVNSGILVVPNRLPDCDYFVTDDQGVKNWNYYKETACNSHSIKLLFKAKLENVKSHFRSDEVVLFNHKSWYEPSNNTWREGGGTLTRDAEAPIVGARTSFATAIHFAYIMGCDPIVLLGCDCCYHGNKRYFWQFPGEQKGYQYYGRDVFSSPNRGRINGSPVDNNCVDFLEYWAKFAEVNKNNANIRYASRGGILKSFGKNLDL